MLASATRNGDRLEVTRLVLALISEREQQIPDALSQHFDLVLRQAKNLAKKPDAFTPDIDPESIALALSITLQGGLDQDFQPIDDWKSISPELAKRLLEQMENSPVY
ncbi:MAG: hypothetical protein AB2598_21105 [Candidatus Thiodiazotropha sp.]